ncbi:MAG: hypothetical protein HN981_03565 [Candidatus Pacebacteria bacterium]|jgi:hypothetical protein|nr:hypothetical protein [Candidatus Paceibacterota bacterium]MBT4652231.1 hypothetical protein [Candidatus Paceibacterota bacterium]MBT6756643.1 hypothetical protein [Candidatus Paceibacterota bacterium]MBT6921441.1 hypothetical protein [Candidatus Paceibacterota bacterium]
MTKKTSSANAVSNLVQDFNTRKLPQKTLKKKAKTGKKRYPVRRRQYTY